VTVVAICSLHASPGATTLALDLARLCGPGTLLIEADPDGGCLAARLDLAVRPGLTELAGAARVGIAADDLWRFAQPTSSALGVIVAHPAAEQVQAALRAAVHHVGSAMNQLSGNVIVDVGRLRPGSPALGFASLADTTLVVAENSVESVVSINHRAQLLGHVGEPLIVLTAAKPYAVAEIEAACGQTVWGVVPRAGRRGRRGGVRERAQALLRLVADCASPEIEEVVVEIPGAGALVEPPVHRFPTPRVDQLEVTT